MKRLLFIILLTISSFIVNAQSTVTAGAGVSIFEKGIEARMPNLNIAYGRFFGSNLHLSIGVDINAFEIDVIDEGFFMWDYTINGKFYQETYSDDFNVFILGGIGKYHIEGHSKTGTSIGGGFRWCQQDMAIEPTYKYTNINGMEMHTISIVFEVPFSKYK